VLIVFCADYFRFCLTDGGESAEKSSATGTPWRMLATTTDERMMAEGLQTGQPSWLPPYLCASAVRWCWCATHVLVALQLSPTHLPCFCLFLLLRMCKRGSSDALSKSKVTQLCHWS